MILRLVSNERLTRQELSWLLAQEARGAAKALREGVGSLQQPQRMDSLIPVETTLDELDDAIGRLSELQSGPRSAARRGRIDLAALLYQVAPNARISMQPGEGTEVFGEEGELRRMLHVLVNQSNNANEGSPSACPEIQIRREETWVRITVDLGPDTAATSELERRWLSRMATRHGGRLELEGGTQTVFLPADASGDEMVELRKELEQAQQLGEVYARELAAAFSAQSGASDRPSALPSLVPVETSVRGLESLKALASALYRPMRIWLEGLRADAALAASELGEQAALSQNLQRRVTGAHEVVGDLRRVAECAIDEPAERIDAVALARDVLAGEESRAARHGVPVVLEAQGPLEITARSAVVGLLLRALIDHAVLATPRGGQVRVAMTGLADGQGIEVVIEDGGPPVPEEVRADLLLHRVNPSSLGRPADLSLLIAGAAASALGSPLELAESAAGKTQVVTRLHPAS